MSWGTTMVSIHSDFIIKDRKMDDYIALLEEILLMTKVNEPDCLFSISQDLGQTRHI